MDIHKPKPWRGWREFLKEYLIIVVGVLTALAAEALVQRLHENRLQAEARESVRGELNVNITTLGRRVRQEACVARQLDEIQALLDRAQAGGSFAPPTTIGRPIWAIIYTQRWQAATAGGRTSLLSSEEQRAFGRVYAQLDVLAQKQVEERHVWMQLRGLVGLRSLSPEMIEGQRMALSAARDLDALIQWDLQEAKYYARQVGVKGNAHLNIRPVSTAPGVAPDNCNPPAASTPAGPHGSSHGRP
jgi:hypothetical protein